jgi:hypothetical protein
MQGSHSFRRKISRLLRSLPGSKAIKSMGIQGLNFSVKGAQQFLLKEGHFLRKGHFLIENTEGKFAVTFLEAIAQSENGLNSEVPNYIHSFNQSVF